MKELKTKKWIRENFKNVFTIVEGWACDYYIIDKDNIISTGYAPINGVNISMTLLDNFNILYKINGKYGNNGNRIYDLSYKNGDVTVVIRNIKEI